MERLEQTYRRLDVTKYAYTASAYGYDDVLEVCETGFVLGARAMLMTILARAGVVTSGTGGLTA